MLFQLALDERHGEARRVERRLHFLEHVGHRADVVFMAVCEEEALQAVLVLLQVRDVRHHVVDARHVVSREGQAAVHDDQALAVLEDGHVHPDLLKAAQRDHLHDPRGNVVIDILFGSRHKNLQSSSAFRPEML